MKHIDNRTSFLLLLGQAASDSRGEMLFGDSLDRVKKTVPDFLGSGPFPDIYLEFPLSGEPYLDISLTAIFDDNSETAYVSSPLAGNTDMMMEYIRSSSLKYPDISGGFEIDTSSSAPTAATVHFQPRSHTELAGGFCESIGEAQYGQLYEEMAGRLKDSWKPSYFGLFRGRGGSPLRVGGYLIQDEIKRCIADPERIIRTFETAGFKAFDDQMIDQIVSVMSLTPTHNEFQFDVFPDGTVGDVFSLSTNFAIETPDKTITALKQGDGARYFDLLKGWHIADSRINKMEDVVFARELPVGNMFITFSVFPQWFKVSWKAANLKSAKGYILIKAGEHGPVDKH